MQIHRQIYHISDHNSPCKGIHTKKKLKNKHRILRSSKWNLKFAHPSSNENPQILLYSNQEKTKKKRKRFTLTRRQRYISPIEALHQNKWRISCKNNFNWCIGNQIDLGAVLNTLILNRYRYTYIYIHIYNMPLSPTSSQYFFIKQSI